MPAYIDTHAHYYDARFTGLGDPDTLFESDDFRASVRAVINVSTNPINMTKVVAQAARYPWMVAAVGIHPTDAEGVHGTEPLDPDTTLTALRDYLSNEEIRIRDKIVALGEIGLDYHWEPMDKPLQKIFFDGQMEIARDLDLPVIIHYREAHGDSFETVLRYPTVRGVFHCYNGSAEMARELVRRGWYIAFGGSVTFKNAERSRAVAASVPLDHLLVETDCPYMTPHPHRGKINHSGYLPLIGDVLADLHGTTPDHIAALTAENAERLFALGRFIPVL